MSSENTRSGASGSIAPGAVVRVTVPPGRSVKLEGGISLQEGDELVGIVREAIVKDGRVKSYDIHSLGLTKVLSDDGAALRADLVRLLSLSAEHSLADVPKSWVGEEVVDNLTARFEAALARKAMLDVLFAHQRPSIAEGRALLDRLRAGHPTGGPGKEREQGTRAGDSDSEDDEEGNKRKRTLPSPLMANQAGLRDEFLATVESGRRETHLVGLDPLLGVSGETVGKLAHLPEHAKVLKELGLTLEAPLPSVRSFKVK